MISHAFFTEDDLYNPVVVLFPEEGTLNNFITAFYKNDIYKDICINNDLCNHSYINAVVHLFLWQDTDLQVYEISI